MAMDALALCIAETGSKFLDWQQLLSRKPELVVGRHAIRYGAVQHLVNAIATQIAVELNVLPSKTSIYIKIGTADQPDA